MKAPKIKIGDLYRYKESTICRVIDIVPDRFDRYPVWLKDKNGKGDGWFHWMPVLEAGFQPIKKRRRPNESA